MKFYKERYGSDNSQNRNEGKKNYNNNGKKNYNNKNSSYKKGDYKKGDYMKNNKNYSNKKPEAAPQKKGLLAKIKAFFGGKK